jgi:hypothetical protein
LGLAERLSKGPTLRFQVIQNYNSIFIFLNSGVLLFELWSSLREILNRDHSNATLPFHTASSSSTAVTTTASSFNVNEELVKNTALDSFSNLKYSLPSSPEDSMMNILQEEYQF